MSSKQFNQIQRLKDRINRARTAFCCSESDDHQAALRTLEILDEEDSEVRRIHTIPLNDKSLHSAQITCRCLPLLKEDGVVVHNAFDSREKFERQNIHNVSDGWVLIEENF